MTRARLPLFALAPLVVACAPIEVPPAKPAAPVIPAPERPEPVERVVEEGDFGLDYAAFGAQVAAAYRSDPAPIAVLPACSEDPHHPPGTQVFASGAGDWVAARALLALREAIETVDLWTPGATAKALQRANRSVGDLRRVEDAIALVAHADGGYVLLGTIATEWVGSRISGRKRVRVQYRCVRADGTGVAELSGYVEDPAAVRALSARAERNSDTPLGARAARFEASLDRELEILTDRAIRRLVAQRRAVFAGKSVAVASASGRILGMIRTRLIAQLPRLLPGREAIAVVDRGADVTLHPSLARGARRWTLDLRVHGAGDDFTVTIPIDDRFGFELERATGTNR